MFDRCARRRRALTRWADGDLSIAERDRLNSHLADCPACTAAEEADHVLRRYLSRPTNTLADEEAQYAFDMRVLSNIAAPAEPTASERLRRWIAGAFRVRAALPQGFFMQIAGGALVAASLTGFTMLNALRPTAAAQRFTAATPSPGAVPPNEPPIPLESLLDTESPRAAMLWTAPSPSESANDLHLSTPRQANRPNVSSPASARSVPERTKDHGALSDRYMRG